MKSSALLTFSILSFAFLAQGEPHFGDPNQAYDRLPGTFETPHVDWATPLAGGKPKALVVLPYIMSREAIELRERVDLDLTVIMTEGRLKRGGAGGVVNGRTPITGTEAANLIDSIMKERLLDRSRHYDVIVLGKIGWNVFKPAEQAEIVRRVKEGAGLVWYEPVGSGADFDSLVGAVDEARTAELLRGYPMDVFPVKLFKTVEEMKKSMSGRPRRSVEVSPLRIRHASLGKGRVVSLDCQDWARSETVFGYAYAPTPAAQQAASGYDYTVYEYHYALAARAILMATGRDVQAVELKLPKKIARSELEKSPLIARVAMLGRETRDERRDDRVSGLASQGSGSRLASHVSRPSSLILEIRPRFAPHGAPAVYEREETIRTARDSRAGSEGGRAREVTSTMVSFNLPVLPAGTYLASVRLRDEKGAAIDFATTAFEVTTDVSLKIATKSDRYPAGTTIEGTVTPSRPLKEGEKIVVKAVDTWGRVVFLGDAVSHRVNKDENSSSGTRQDAASTKDDKFHSPTPTLNSNYTFSIPVVTPLSRLWDLEAAVVDASGVVAKAKTWAGIPNWTFDDYSVMLIFAPSPCFNDWKGDYHTDLMHREMGVDSTYAEIIYNHADMLELNERHHIHTVSYSAHYGENAGVQSTELSNASTPNTNLDMYAAIEMLEGYIASGCKPQSEKDYPYNQRGLRVGEFNNKIPIYDFVGKFGTPFYSVTMENYLSGEFEGLEDSGFGPRTTLAFQRWCRKEYGNDIAKLNAEWNTSFKSFDEVSGVMMVPAVENGQEARWVDFRYFMRSEVWSGFFLTLEKFIHTITPGLGRVGFGAHTHHDFTKYRGDVMTSGKLYVAQCEDWEWEHAVDCEMRQSFANDRGWWLGSQSILYWKPDLCDPIKRQRNPWAMLFMGLRGFNCENSLGFESFGGMSWEYPDYSGLLPFAAEMAKEVKTLQRGIGKLWMAALPRRAPVAIDWSPRNHYISRLHPEQPRGFTGTWMYNIALNSGAPSDALCLMNSLRIRPKFIAPEDDFSPYRVLWLPYNKGMGEKEAAAIRAFVRAGGLVLADNEPGIYTEHGKPRKESILKDLFPDFSRVTVTACGKGRAAYLAGKLNCYPDRMLKGDYAGSDLVAGLLAKYADVKPSIGLTAQDGTDVRNVRVSEYDIGGTRLIGFLRRHHMGEKNDEVTYAVDFGGECEIYDVTKQCAYLGRHAKMNLALDRYAKCLALVPAKIEGAKLAATAARSSSAPYQAKPGETVCLNLTVSTPQPLNPSTSQLPLTDAWHLEVFAPDGAELECYRKNCIVEGGSLKLSLPIALNAAKGTYKAVMTSAISGVRAEAEFDVK